MTPIMFRKGLAIVSMITALTADISKADVSITQHGKQGGPSSGEWTRTLRIKGLKMRIDTRRNGDEFITIYDLSSGKGYQLYPNRKEAIVVDLRSASGSQRAISADKLKQVVKETGKKREIGNVSCEEYTFSLPSSYSAPGYGVTLLEDESGTFCVSRTIPEGIEVANFVQEAMKRGYRVATSPLSPTQSSVGSYFLGPEPNLVVVATTIQSKIKGPNAKSGIETVITTTFTISEIRSDSIPNEDFQIPADWKQKKESNFR